MPDALIKGTDIGYRVGDRQLLRHIDLSVGPGQIVTLIGPNGAGKTTLVRLALGLIQPTSGTLTRRPGLRIGYMPQQLSLSDTMPISVQRFLTLGDSNRQHCAQRADEIGITHLLDRPMQALSGGETQRVLLARAMARRPNLLVLDEPVQGVDINGQSELYQLIRRLRDDHGCAVLMVSHDLHLVMAATDEVLCINQHVCCSGHPDAVSQHPAYLDLFGGAETSGLGIYTHHHDHAHDLHGNIVAEHKDH